MNTNEITFNRRRNLDDIGQAGMLLFKYVAMQADIDGMSEHDGIVAFDHGERLMLTRDDAEERAEELMALYAEHVAGRRELEDAVYRFAARARQIIDDIAAARGCITPSELIEVWRDIDKIPKDPE
jgi:hypothetical protein